MMDLFPPPVIMVCQEDRPEAINPTPLLPEGRHQLVVLDAMIVGRHKEWICWIFQGKTRGKGGLLEAASCTMRYERRAPGPGRPTRLDQFIELVRLGTSEWFQEPPPIMVYPAALVTAGIPLEEEIVPVPWSDWSVFVGVNVFANVRHDVRRGRLVAHITQKTIQLHAGGSPKLLPRLHLCNLKEI